MIYQTAGGEEESRSVGVGIRVEGKSAYIHELHRRFQEVSGHYRKNGSACKQSVVKGGRRRAIVKRLGELLNQKRLEQATKRDVRELAWWSLVCFCVDCWGVSLTNI